MDDDNESEDSPDVEADFDEFGWDPDVDDFLRDRVAEHGENWQMIALDFWQELVEGQNSAFCKERFAEVFGPSALAARWDWLKSLHSGDPESKDEKYEELAQPLSELSDGSCVPEFGRSTSSSSSSSLSASEKSTTCQCEVDGSVKSCLDAQQSQVIAALSSPEAAKLLLLLSNRCIAFLRLGHGKHALWDAAAGITLANLWAGEAWENVRGKVWLSYCKALIACQCPELSQQAADLASEIIGKSEAEALHRVLDNIIDSRKRDVGSILPNGDLADAVFVMDSTFVPSSKVSPAQRCQNAEEWRQCGNEHFKHNSHEDAAFCYTVALCMRSSLGGGRKVARLLNLLAQSHLKNGTPLTALSLSTTAFALTLGCNSRKLRILQEHAQSLSCEALLRLRRPTAAKAVIANCQSIDYKPLLETCQKQVREEAGHFDWSSYYLLMLAQLSDQSAAMEPLGESSFLDVADFVGPVVVANIVGKGRGLVASSRIYAGQLLVCTRALAVTFGLHSRDQLVHKLQKSLTSGGSSPARVVSMLHRQGLPPDGNAGHSKFTPTPWDMLGRSSRTSPMPLLPVFANSVVAPEFTEQELCQVLNANTLEHTPSEKPEEVVSGLWPLIAMCNHSDRPTATYSIFGPICVLRAVHNLEAGDEVCINYTPWDFSTIDRDEKLQQVWGIPTVPMSAEQQQVEVRANSVSECLATYRASHGWSAAKAAILQMAEAFTQSGVGPSRATAYRLAVVYCLRERDHDGACHASLALVTAAQEAAPVGEHVVECFGAYVLVVFTTLGKHDKAACALRAALEATAQLYGLTDDIHIPRATAWRLLFWRVGSSIWAGMLGFHGQRLASLEKLLAAWYAESPKEKTHPHRTR